MDFLLNIRQDLKVGPGLWLTFQQKKNFVGQVTDKASGQLKVKFTRNKDKGIFCRPKVDDECMVTEDQILRLLPEPNPGRRGEVIFSAEFTSFNIQ